MVVCCVAQENGACVQNMGILTRKTMYDFTPVCNFVISCLNRTKFTVQMPAYEGRLHIKLEVNCTSHS